VAHATSVIHADCTHSELTGFSHPPHRPHHHQRFCAALSVCPSRLQAQLEWPVSSRHPTNRTAATASVSTACLSRIYGQSARSGPTAVYLGHCAAGRQLHAFKAAGCLLEGLSRRPSCWVGHNYLRSSCTDQCLCHHAPRISVRCPGMAAWLQQWDCSAPA
jgi:hypothetical protein